MYESKARGRMTHTGRLTKLVIFDCDGVLVDSEPIENAEMASALTSLGIELDGHLADELIGLADDDAETYLRRKFGNSLPDDFMARHRQRTLVALERRVAAFPNAAEVVVAVKARGAMVAVASNGEPEKMTTTLGVTGLLPLFEGRLFSRANVVRGKPGPDLFLMAAADRGIPPESCLVVEDSWAGMQAAVAAGMPFVAFRPSNRASQDPPAGPLGVIDDLMELLKFVRTAPEQSF
jgi:HAD superfamily hydrolase (TIGR01509 family)